MSELSQLPCVGVCDFCFEETSSLTRQESYGHLDGYACSRCSIERFTHKKFITIPACPDMTVYEAKECFECRIDIPKHGPNKCPACIEKRGQSLQVAKKPSDSNYYRIIIAASVLITIGYAYLIWCLL